MTIETAEPRVLTDNHGRTLTAEMTDEEASGWCRRVRDNTFASDLVTYFDRSKGRLSPARLYWLHKLAMEQKAKENPPPPAFAFPGVVEFLNRAVASGRRKTGGCVTFRNDGGVVQVRGYRGPKEEYNGSFWVNNGVVYSSGDNVLYGRLEKDGGFRPNKHLEFPLPAHVLALLDELGNDPESFVAKYGRLSGRCCFCDTSLTDEVSVGLGYGPVCAKTYNLKWGKKFLPKEEAK